MNIAIVVPSLIRCGPINVALEIIKNVNRSQKEIYFTIVCMNKNFDESLITWIHSQNLAGIVFLSDITLHLETFFKKFDVVHSHGFYPDKLLSELKIQVKKISTIHCMFYKDYPKEYGLVKGYIGAFLHMKILKKGNFDYIVGCSKSVGEYVYSNTKLDNIVHINNGVDQSLFFPLDEVSKRKRLIKMGFNNYKRIFTYSGRLIRRKRVPELIDYFSKVAKPDDLLIILGDGEELDCCKKKSKDNIFFAGHVNNPEEYYKISNYIISNSAAEGYPMSILEAVSCGCFALLSNIQPHIEFIESNPNLSKLIGDFDFHNEDEKFLNNSFSQLSSSLMANKYLDFYMD